jgi:hypothetical protein
MVTIYGMPSRWTPVARLLPVLLLCLTIGMPTAALGGETGSVPAASAKKKCKKKKKKKCKKKKAPAQPQPVVTPAPLPLPLAPGVPGPPPVIQLSQGALTVTEGATDMTTTVRLAAQPASSVTVSLSSSDPAAATVNPPTLTFTPANYATPQPITVGGTEDPDAVAESATVTATSAGATAVTLDVTVTDNDSAGITVLSPDGGATVPEGGTDSSITIVLNAQPQADVEIPLGSSAVAKMTVSPTSVTFTAANWNVPQTVTLTGIEDPDVINDNVFLRTFPATSADPGYSGLNAADPSIVVNDNDD